MDITDIIVGALDTLAVLCMGKGGGDNDAMAGCLVIVLLGSGLYWLVTRVIF